MESQARSASAFRNLLATVDPRWSDRSEAERDDWVAFYARTARAIARQYASSFRDPCHDESDVMQEIRIKIWKKFGPRSAPHRLLTERPCVRNLMDWRAMDLVDWENADKRNARLRATLPDEDVGMPDRCVPRPDRMAELTDTERAFRREIRDPEDRKAYLLFKAGRSTSQVARLLGRSVRDVKDIRRSLSEQLAGWLRR